MSKLVKFWQPVGSCDAVVVAEVGTSVFDILEHFPCDDFYDESLKDRAEAFADEYIHRMKKDQPVRFQPDYVGKGIFIVNTFGPKMGKDGKVRNNMIISTWLVRAETIEQAEEKFRALDAEERAEGDEPLVHAGEEINIEPLEFERDVCQM